MIAGLNLNRELTSYKLLSFHSYSKSRSSFIRSPPNTLILAPLRYLEVHQFNHLPQSPVLNPLIHHYPHVQTPKPINTSLPSPHQIDPRPSQRRLHPQTLRRNPTKPSPSHRSILDISHQTPLPIGGYRDWNCAVYADVEGSERTGLCCGC